MGKPTILTFDLRDAMKNQRPDGSIAVGVVTAGFMVWSHHFAFENGLPVLTMIGEERDTPASLTVGRASGLA